MFTHRNNEKSNERGALMIEAIALLGLMSMMSPMIVRQTADRTAEMEEVAIAGQMKEIKDALSNWIEANYQEKAKELSAASASDDSFTVTATDLAPYLPATYLTDTGTFKGNKLVDGFDVGVRAQCTEARSNSCTPSSTNDCACGTRTNGTISGLSADCACSRYKMTGVVLSKTNNSAELDDRRAARIASMIGADGGYMRTAKMVNAIATNGATDSEMKKILGSQGIWEGDVTSYFDTTAAGIDLTKGGRIAATTIYSSGFSGDYLYRKKVDGLPGANSMFTDLDMGGATNCEGDGCHNINNAGGLEVVGGKILIRSKNDEDNQGLGSGDTYARIALATDSSHMKVTDSLDFSVSSADNVADMDTITSGTRFSMNTDQFTMKVDDDTSLNMAAGSLVYNSGSQELKLNSDAATLAYNGASFLNFSNSGAHLNTTIAGNTGSFFIDNASGFSAGIQSTKDITLDAQKDIFMASSGNTEIYADNSAKIRANNAANIYSNNINLLASNNTSTTINSQTNISRLSLNNTQSTLIGKNSLLLHVEKETGNAPYLYMNSQDFALSGTFSALYSKGSHLNMEVATSRTSSSNYMNIALNPSSRAGIYLNSSGIQAVVGRNTTSNKSNASFSLTNSNFLMNIGLVNNSTPRYQMHLNNGRFSLNYINNISNINDKYTVAYLASIYTNRAKLNVNADTGAVTNSTYAGSNALVTIVTTADDNTGIAPYNEHGGDTKYDHFRIDPSFISVMNDIKVTSRGGARLSEALPNYILKGIYELSNSYGSGPWPCDDGSCVYKMPHYTLQELGLSSGGWEFHCDAAGAPDGHPIKKGGGTCSVSGDAVQFSQAKSTYTECSGFCWAHPFMGAVPAPGREVNEGGYRLAAYDEGVCPDGYQAVMTVTPTVFELGKVQMITSNKHEDASVFYNPGWQDYSDPDIVSLTGIIQASTKLGMLVEPITSGTTLNGWKIAMGTVTLTSGTPGYIWNAGGIAANTWSAIVHTYCYFNPDRFTMPNMIIKDGKLIQAADNPNLD